MAIINGYDPVDDTRTISVLINDSPSLNSRLTSVSAAAYTAALAPESIASAFGSDLATSAMAVITQILG